MAKLLTDQKNPQAWKALIAASYAGVKVDVPAFNPESAELEAKSPHLKIPVLETAEGTLFEANAIARYIARLSKSYPLYGASVWEAGAIENWIDFAANEIELPGSVWTFPILGKIPNNPNATQRAKGDIRKVFDTLNKHLLTRTFLVGQRLSLADIVVAMSLYNLYELVLDLGFRKAFPNTNRWYLTIVNQPLVKAIIGEVNLCQKMQVAKAEEGAKEGGKQEKKEQPKKEAAPKQEKKEQPKQEKKEQPKKEAPKKKEESEEPEEESFEEKKKKSKLDFLPPSKFVLDEWKRTYSNEDTVTKAIPWFWENFDKEGYSLWVGDYKYPEENNKLFMTLNLVNGYIQRLEGFRKYGFGSLCLFGEEPRLEIGCCFLVRGTEIPEEMTDAPDTENYNWRKIDPSSEADRKLVNDYWAWEKTIAGRTFNQGKIFK